MLIIVSGEVVVEVFSTSPFDVLILDHDEHTEATTETTLSKFAGEFEPQELTVATRHLLELILQLDGCGLVTTDEELLIESFSKLAGEFTPQALADATRQ